MYFIDTNIFLEVLMEREKCVECTEFLRKIVSGEISGVTSVFAIHSIELALAAEGNAGVLKRFLGEITKIESLLVYPTQITEEIETLDMMKQIGLDFDDALQYFVAKRFNCKAIISFDKHFDGLNIPRKEPKEVI